MKNAIVYLSLLLASPVAAAERAIVANDQEITALIQLIDEALKAKGVAVTQNATYWINKIQAAPTVTSQQEIKPDDATKE